MATKKKVRIIGAVALALSAGLGIGISEAISQQGDEPSYPPYQIDDRTGKPIYPDRMGVMDSQGRVVGYVTREQLTDMRRPGGRPERLHDTARENQARNPQPEGRPEK